MPDILLCEYSVRQMLVFFIILPMISLLFLLSIKCVVLQSYIILICDSKVVNEENVGKVQFKLCQKM